MMDFPKIGFTLGDPGGVGPEIVFDSISSTFLKCKYTPVLYGAKSLLNSSLWRPLIDSLDICLCENVEDVRSGCVNFIDCGLYKG